MPCVFLSRPSSVLPCSSRHAYPAQAFPQAQPGSAQLKIANLWCNLLCTLTQSGTRLNAKMQLTEGNEYKYITQNERTNSEGDTH